MKKLLSLFLLILFAFNCNNFVYANDFKIYQSDSSTYVIFIDINELSLSLIDKQTNKTEKIYPIAIGSTKTPSPIGQWKISNKAFKNGPFGGYWLGLNVPWDTFGIHGTNRPDSIGSLASSGCFRMYNNHIKELFGLVEHNTPVIVYGGPNWLFSYYVRVIHPKDKGTDVYHVQQRLKDLGYFKDTINGIYNYSLELAVLKYKQDNNLSGDTEINQDFLNSIGLIKFE